PPRADAAAEAQLEGEELAAEGTLLRVEHDAGARVHRADAPCRGEPRARLPAHAEVGEEVAAGVAVLGEHLVAAVAVVADGRRADEDRGRRVEPGERLGEQRRAPRAALEERGLLGVGPPAGADV